MDVFGAFSGQLNIFLLVLARVTGMLGATPFFASRSIPAQVKAAFALILTFALFPVAGAAVGAKAGAADGAAAGAAIGLTGGMTQGIPLSDTYGFVAAVAGEVVVGFAFGVLVSMAFAIFQVAGEMIDIPIGFSLVNVMDPLAGQAQPIIARFFYVIALLVFLAIDGHLYLIEALARSFQMVPPGSFQWWPKTAEVLVKYLTASFLLAVKVALPVVGALLVTDVAFGLVARAVPQINVFIVGFPAKILVGLVFLALMLPLIIGTVQDTFAPRSELHSSLEAILRGSADPVTGGGR